MPSTVIKNRAFLEKGIVLTSEDAQEQGNGLVTASLNFVVDADKARNFSFTLDDPPPIYPRAIERGRLQASSLFMTDRSTRYENGFVYVQAQYAGALNVQARDRFITNEFETISVNLRIQSGSIFSETTNNFVPVFDNYVISYRRKIITYEIATLDGLIVSRIPTPDPENLIVSATYALRQFSDPGFGQRTFFPPLDARKLLIANADLITTVEENTSFVTPTVKVYKISFVPEALINQ
jgi:hypothetical protein